MPDARGLSGEESEESEESEEKEMKALTLRQPWASAVAWGEKAIEHRSWPTRYRGPLLIHASSRPYTLELEDGEVMPLPYSAIIARVILADVHLFTQADCEGACVESPPCGFVAVIPDDSKST